MKKLEQEERKAKRNEKKQISDVAGIKSANVNNIPGKLQGKRKKESQVAEYESDSGEDDDDPECIICSETFSASLQGEGWIQCVVCRLWAHDECAGIDDDDTGIIGVICAFEKTIINI